MLYLLDANVLITANRTYYPIDQVPDFWSWVHHQGVTSNIKLPREIMEEVKAGRKDKDPLIDWLSDLKSPAGYCWKKTLTSTSCSTSSPMATQTI